VTDDLHTPLSDEELDRLDRFLLDRVDEDAVTDGMDEGVLGVTELDGFLTAIVSGPVTVMPSQWLPAVWGDCAPVWEDEQAFQDIFALLVRHMNVISAMLMDAPGEFEPLFGEREVDGQFYTIVDEWCEGYRRGVQLAQDAWDSGGEAMAMLLAPILAFTEETYWRGHDCASDETVQLQQVIPSAVREIHAYWLTRRAGFQSSSQPVRRSGPRVGRNDPCPCGSGRKYKHCCLQ
jgi:uncharacterized protein